MIASDPSYEKVFAEIYFDERFVALVSQEEGTENMKVEFPGNDVKEDMILRKVQLRDFQNALDEAVKKLNVPMY